MAQQNTYLAGMALVLARRLSRLPVALFALALACLACTSCTRAQSTNPRNADARSTDARSADARSADARSAGARSASAQSENSKVALNTRPPTGPFIESEGQKIFYQKIYSFKGIPWGFDFLSPNLLIVSLKNGKIYLLKLPTTTSKAILYPIQNSPQTQVIGQGGMMDVRLHPQFKSNRWVYFSYVQNTAQGSGTHIARAQLNNAPPYKLTQLKVLFTPSPAGQGGRHFGSRIEWGAANNKHYLFFSIGDRAERTQAQNLNDPRGKIFRLFDDGSLPPDNPFASTKKNRNKAYPGVWSYGHRNPQGLFRHPHTGQLWSNEHGPRGGDEINLIQAGLNYGWPTITYGREYWGPRIGTTHKKGLQQPVKYFVPSIAPSSLMIYSGKKFKKWKGDFFSTSLTLTHLNRLVIKNKKVLKQERLFKNLGQRWRHIRENSKGDIFFSTDSGHLYKM